MPRPTNGLSPTSPAINLKIDLLGMGSTAFTRADRRMTKPLRAVSLLIRRMVTRPEESDHFQSGHVQ
jgi:hypothetical protein